MLAQRQESHPPLRLRLVKVKIGKANVWLLTSVLDCQQLNKKQLIQLYKMRWGIEVEFRGLKQTLGNSKLRCRKADRCYAELDWSILAMAVAKLYGLKEQLAKQRSKSANTATAEVSVYTPKDLSLAGVMRAIENCLDALCERPSTGEDLFTNLERGDRFLSAKIKKTGPIPTQESRQETIG